MQNLSFKFSLDRNLTERLKKVKVVLQELKGGLNRCEDDQEYGLYWTKPMDALKQKYMNCQWNTFGVLINPLKPDIFCFQPHSREPV